MGRDVGDDLRRQARHRAARELRDLADRIEAGELPDRGAVVDLARKIERMVTDERPAKGQTERSKQARALAGMLSKRTGTTVHLLHTAGRGGQGRIGSYTVEWANGPTDRSIRQLVAEFAGRVPALDVKQLSYRRTFAPRVEVACLLRHLDAHPADGRTEDRRRSTARGSEYERLDRLAHELALDVEYPERIDEDTGRRVQAVYALGRKGPVSGSAPTTEAWLTLGQHISAHGWRATRTWLDEVAGRDAPDAVRPDERRPEPPMSHDGQQR